MGKLVMTAHPLQDLTDASILQEDGATTLTFTATRSYLLHFSPDARSVIFIFAYSQIGAGFSIFGDHGPRRGVISIPSFLGGVVAPPPPPPPPPRVPQEIELTPHEGVRLSLAHGEGTLARVELTIHKQVATPPHHPQPSEAKTQYMVY